MALKPGFALGNVKDFPEKYVKKLTELYITTAEEFVSLASREDTKEKIAQFLEINKKDLAKLNKVAKSVLSEEVVKEIERPAEIKKGLGLILDRERENKKSE